MTVTYAIITACSAVYANSPESDPNTAAGRAVVAFFFIYYLFYNLAMSPLLCAYTLEILPYNLRTKGLFVSSMSVNCSLVFNQYVSATSLVNHFKSLKLIFRSTLSLFPHSAGNTTLSTRE